MDDQKMAKYFHNYFEASMKRAEKNRKDVLGTIWFVAGAILIYLCNQVSNQVSILGIAWVIIGIYRRYEAYSEFEDYLEELKDRSKETST